MKKTVNFHDYRNGATSPIDTIDVPVWYTAEDYLKDCKNNADDEWNEMLASGEVILDVPEEEIKLAILMTDHCTAQEAKKHLKDGADIYVVSESAFVAGNKVFFPTKAGFENTFVMGESQEEIDRMWNNMPTVSFEDGEYKINYVL